MKEIKSMQELWKDSYLSGGNESYLESLYETYLKSPDSVAPEWQAYFSNLSTKSQSDVSHEDVRHYFEKMVRQPAASISIQGIDLEHEQKQEKVIDLISAYRSLGHL